MNTEVVSTTKEKKGVSSFYNEALLEKQAEINDYKRRTLELLEGQKNYLEQISIDISKLEEERNELKLQLKEKEENLFKIAEQYQRIKSTKIMKWVEQYWKLRKKIRFKKI